MYRAVGYYPMREERSVSLRSWACGVLSCVSKCWVAIGCHVCRCIWYLILKIFLTFSSTCLLSNACVLGAVQ